MNKVIKFPTKVSRPVARTGPYFCGRPLELAYAKPKRSSPKLVEDVAQIYSEIPADLGRGQAAFVYVSTVLQFSRQILRELADQDLADQDLADLGLMVEAAGEAGRSPDRDELDFLVDMVNDETERRGGANN